MNITKRNMKVLKYKDGLPFLQEDDELLFPAQIIASIIGVKTHSLTSRKNIQTVARFSRESRRNQNFIYESAVQELVPDPELWKLVKHYKKTGELISGASSFETIIRAGLIYRSIRHGRYYKIEVPKKYEGELDYVTMTQPWATELPTEITLGFIQEVSNLYIKAPFICQGVHLKDFRLKVEALYPPVYSVTQLHKYYGVGFPQKLLDLLVLEWSQHSDWQERLISVLEPFKEIEYGYFANQPVEWPKLSSLATIESYN